MGKKKEQNTFRVTQYQLSDEVTGSAMLLTIRTSRTKEYNILLDFGLIQNDTIPFEKRIELDKQRLWEVPLNKIDAVILSHANYDHISALPLCAKKDEDGEDIFNGKIITTQLTSELTSHILRDGTKIMESEVAKYNADTGKNLKPLYIKEDTENVLTMIRGYSYNEKIWLKHNLYVELLPSGHIAGSCLIYITLVEEYGKKHFMYCPDMYYGDCPRPFTKSIERKCHKASMVVLESTYGNKPSHPKVNPIDFLEKIIMDWVVERNNILWIPTFSMQRSTQLCYMINEIYKRNEIFREANIPMYNVGKLTKLCHDTIGKNAHMEEGFYDEQWCEDRTIFDNTKIAHIEDKLDVEHFVLNNQRKIVLSSSGAITNGFSSMIGDSFIANKKVGILACGYIFPQSTLDKISKGDKNVVHNGISRTRRCSYLGVIPQLSGHVDCENNILWVKSFNQRVLRCLVLSHGTEEAKEHLKQELEKIVDGNVVVAMPKFKEVVKC